MLMSHQVLLLVGLLMVWAYLRWRRERRLRWALLIGAFAGFGAITRPVAPARFDGRHIVDMGYKANGRGYVPNARTAPRTSGSISGIGAMPSSTASGWCTANEALSATISRFASVTTAAMVRLTFSERLTEPEPLALSTSRYPPCASRRFLASHNPPPNPPRRQRKPNPSIPVRSSSRR